MCLLSGAFLLRPFRAQGQQKTAPGQPKTAPGQQKPATQANKKNINYEKFTHKSHVGTINVPETNHARVLKCDSCHDRPTSNDIAGGIVGTTDRNKRFTLKFPGHKACVECHVTQFTARPQQTCTVCHETKEGLNARPPQRDFPLRYDFNAYFDAKQHELHGTYLLPGTNQKTDCNFCHKQEAKPSILTIPSHPECYVCHSPNSGDEKGSKKSDCKACHTDQTLETLAIQPFSAKYVSRAYGALFTHKAHVDYMSGKCDMCHTIEGGYNRPTPTSIKVKEHQTTGERTGRGCFSCHDGGMHYGRKVFSGEPGSEGGGSCNRCHKREDFKVIATS
ncbi:MAG TPA: cytochrome c3 family protein [Blastocatellia bacterium]|nr:cytochrome c3 family protein [Blastocatellia bacterium]